MKTRRRAFTLIELLIVIFIVSLLATLAVVAYQQARIKARDSKRIADIKQIKTALELFFNENSRYPTIEEWNSGSIVSFNSGEVFMNNIPTAPVPADGNCSEASNIYHYIPNDLESPSSYVVEFCISNQIGELPEGAKELTVSGIIEPTTDDDPVFLTCGDYLRYGGHNYQTVQINGQCWFRENLKIDNGCSIVGWINSYDTGWCGCYNNKKSNCDAYGKLYQWSAIMNGSTQEGAQGLCPDGWHIPTDSEWESLLDYLSLENEYLCDNNSDYVAKSVANKFGWKEDSSSCRVGNSQSYNNSANFNAKSSGKRDLDGLFGELEEDASFWSSSSNGESYSWGRFLKFNSPNISKENFHKSRGLSVRCIKN